MDTPVTPCFSELGLEDPFVSDECDIFDFLKEDLSAAIGEDFQCSLSPEINSSSSKSIPRCSSSTSLCASSVIEAPQEWPNSYNSSTIHNIMITDQSCPTPMTLSFGNLLNVPENISEQANIGMVNQEDDAVSEMLVSRGSNLTLEGAKVDPQKKKNCRPRPPSQTYDHIIAERKRREQLSQQFVALSSIVPGLKKTDKTSVLGDAINYLKHLQEKVKTLEEQTTKKSMESVVIVNKSRVSLEDEGYSDEQGSSNEQPLPQIEAKEFNLSITSTNVTTIGGPALDITIIAEMEEEFDLSIEDILRSLQSALQANR